MTKAVSDGVSSLNKRRDNAISETTTLRWTTKEGRMVDVPHLTYTGRWAAAL